MVIQELVERSPVRILEQSIGGSLKAGEIGVIAAPSGIGKTSVLVQLALDKLLQNKEVIHVSFTVHANYVMAWYENIFDESINKKGMSDTREIKNELVKNRVLMNFSQETVGIHQLLRSIKALVIEGGFPAELLIIDGLDFTVLEAGALNTVKQCAAELGMSIWYSCTVEETGYDERNIPLLLSPHLEGIDVIIRLKQKPDHIVLSISKSRGLYNPDTPLLNLDPRTLLLRQ
jgi:hypothetical protein